MTWNEYVDVVLRENDFSEQLNNIKISFSDDNKRIEPSIYTRFNSYILKSMELYEHKQICFVYPNDPLFLFSVLIYKTFYELYNGDTKDEFDLSSYEVGDVLCLGKSVFKLISLDEQRAMFEFKKGKGVEHNGRLLNKLPPLSKAKQGAEINGYKLFLEEISKYTASDSDTVVGKLHRFKNLRNNTIFIIGPVKKYQHLFESCYVEDKKLLDLVNVGRVERSGELKPINGNFDNYHIILSPDLNLCLNVIEQSNYPVESVFFDLHSKNNVNEYLLDIDDLRSNNIETVLFVQENSSFDYEPLKIRNFVFFQWKKNYLLNNIFEKYNNDVSLNSFSHRNISFVHLDDNGLSDLYYEFLKYRNEVEDMPAVAINAYVAFFNTIKDELPKYCYLLDNEIKIFDKMYNLDKHCQNLTSVKKEIIGSHPLIKSAQDTYKYIFDYLGYENEKIKYIWDKVTKINDYDDKIAIVVSDSTNVDDVYRYYSIKLSKYNYVKLYFDVVNVSDFQHSKWHYKTAIFVGWFRKEIMKTALLSNNSDENIVLLYNCEIPWVKSAGNVWNNNMICNDFSKINVEINDDNMEKVFDFNESSDVNDDLDITSQKQSDLFIKGLLKDNSDTEFIEAIPIIFSNNTYAFFPTNKTLVSASLLISGDSETLESIMVSDIKQGDVLVIKDNSSSDVLEEIANKILNNEDVLAQSKCWKDAIVQKMSLFQLTINEMIDEIVAAGCKKNRNTIRNWIVNNSIISPRDFDDLKYISAATSDMVLEENSEKIFAACKQVKSARIKAGFELAETILNSEEIKKAAKNYAINGVLNIKNQAIDIKGVGTASILKVIEIGEPQDFPKVLCNKRREN